MEKGEKKLKEKIGKACQDVADFMDIEITGSGFIEIVRNKKGKAIDVRRIPPGNIVIYGQSPPKKVLGESYLARIFEKELKRIWKWIKIQEGQSI